VEFFLSLRGLISVSVSGAWESVDTFFCVDSISRSELWVVGELGVIEGVTVASLVRQ
jgi:hypothetical protein